MNRRDLHFVRTQYAPGVDCVCKANAYEWQFCEMHQAIENARHASVLGARIDKLDWLDIGGTPQS